MLSKPEQIFQSLKPRITEALLHGGIWAFSGLLFAILFVTFAVFAENWLLPLKAYLFGGVMAGTISALMYSSMRLVVFISLVLFPFGIFFFINSIDEIVMSDLLKILIPPGLVIGAAYGFFSKRSQIGHADAKTLAGFSAGFLASLCYLLIQAIIPGIDLAWSVGVLSTTTGAFYIMLVPIYVRLYHDLLPPFGDGALVGVASAVFISFSLFMMAGSIDTFTTGELIPEIASILELFPDAALGGVVGSGLMGIIFGFVLTNWQDRNND